MSDRYTVVYEGDPTGVKILSGEPAPGRAVGVIAGDLAERYRAEDERVDAETQQLRADLLAATAEAASLRGEVDRLTKTLKALRDPSWRALEAARNAKINGSVFTMDDWVQQATKEDLPHLGIPWPEMAYDRRSTINEDLHHLLLTTWWRAIFNAMALTPPAARDAGETGKGDAR